MARSKKFYLIESKGFMYCVPAKDVKTVDASTVGVGDCVQFKYGSSSYEGDVLFMSGHESGVFDEISKLKKARKELKRANSSFHSDQPRKAAVKQKELMKSVNGEKILKKKTSQKEKAEKKAVAEEAFENDGGDDEGGDVVYMSEANNNDSSKTSSPVSSASSIVAGMPTKSKEIQSKDIKRLKALETSTDSEQDSNLNAVKEVSYKQSDLDSTIPVSEELNETLSKVEDDRKLLSVDSSVDKHSDNAKSDVDKIPKAGTSDDTGVQKDSDSSDSSSDDSSDDTELRKKIAKYLKKLERKKKSKSKRSKKRKQRLSSSSDLESSDASDSGAERKRKKAVIKRNMEVFPGQNYLYAETDADVVKLHDNYDVYIKKTTLDHALTNARSPMGFIRAITDKVYTKEALAGATAQGFPARCIGMKRMKKRIVLPRLHPDGREAVLARARQLEDERKAWRPRVGNAKMSEAFTQRVGEFKE